MSKVFGIGFQKTGTMSLAGVVLALGYSLSYKNAWWKTDPDLAEHIEDLAFEAAEKSDAFVNNPWPMLYQQLDEKYPGSKFILTIRDEQEWLESARRHFSGIKRPEIPWIYGVEGFDGNEDVFLERYRRHNAEVQEYFKDRPADLLVIDVTKNPEWKPICDFLGKPVPERSFPHANKTGTLRQEFQKHYVPVVSKVREWASAIRSIFDPK